MFFSKKEGSASGETVQLPLLPLRDIVVFPHMVVPLFVGRDRSIKALEVAAKSGKMIFLASQKEAQQTSPGKEDIYSVGTISNIIQMLRLPDNTIKVFVEGRSRGRIRRYLDGDGFFNVEAEVIEDEIKEREVEIQGLVRGIKSVLENYIAHNNIGNVCQRKAVYEVEHGLDPQPSLRLSRESLQEAIRINPKYAFAYGNLGLTYGTTAEYLLAQNRDPSHSLLDAREALQKMNELNPNNFAVFQELGRVEWVAARWTMKSGRNPEALFEKAQAALRRSMELNPQEAEPYVILADLLLSRATWKQSDAKDLLKEGIAMADKALSLNPRSSRAAAVKEEILKRM